MRDRRAFCEGTFLEASNGKWDKHVRNVIAEGSGYSEFI